MHLLIKKRSKTLIKIFEIEIFHIQSDYIVNTLFPYNPLFCFKLSQLFLFFFLTSLLEYNFSTMVCYFLLYKKVNRRINQNGGVEGRALTPSCESTRITTGCWTIIDRKTLDFTKEDTPRPRTEEKPQ